MATIPQERRILNSWKEVSNFLGRGVRTVQRWEFLYAMPVHRPAGRPRSAVVAFSDELEHWLDRKAALIPELRDSADRRDAHSELMVQLHVSSTTLLERGKRLQEQTATLQALVVKARTSA